ncbi:MAG: MFS transporter [Alphaproteobacteria bacterium]|nr:MFS transporter [Alphaproteobacteria bacterium]
MSKRALLIMISASVIILLSMGLRNSFGLFLRPVSDALLLNVQVFSFAIAIQNLLWGLSQPFAGAIAEKYGSGKVIAVAGLLHILGLIILANADSAWDLYTGAGLIIGIAGSGCTFAVLLAVVARNVSAKHRSTALGITAACGTLGQITMAPATQYLLSDFGWSVAFIVLAALLALIVPLAAMLTGKSEAAPGTDIAGADTLSGALAEVARHRGYILLNLGFFVCGFHVLFIMAHFPNFLVSSGFPTWLPVYALSTIGVTNLISTLIAGWLGDRYSKKYLLSTLYFLRAIVFAVFLMVPLTTASVLIFSGAIGSLWLATVPLTSGLVGQIFGVRFLATLFGIVFLSHQLGSFAAVWLGGYVFDKTGSYDLVWQISVVLGIVAAILHLPIAERPLIREAAAA